MAQAKPTGTWQDWVFDRILRGLIGTALALPWSLRGRFIGWFLPRILAPLVGSRAPVTGARAQPCSHRFPPSFAVDATV